MKVIIKMISFYAISIFMGNLLCFLSGLVTHHDAMVAYTNLDTLWIIPVASAFLCLPLFVPILIYFPLLSLFKISLPKRIFLSLLFGTALGASYIFVVDEFIGWIGEIEIWAPFVVGAGLSGVLTEIFFNRKPHQNETFDSIVMENT